MQPINHPIIHQYQPTSTSCSQTALSMMLSTYGMTLSVDEIARSVPQVKNDAGEDFGTINQQLATYCIGLGYETSLHTFDCQIIDQSWSDLPNNVVRERLIAAMDGWEPAGLGSTWSNTYRQAYIDFIDAGGQLTILPYVTSKLLYRLLEEGPILACLCFNTLYGSGRTSDFEDTTKFDDINGRTWNHSVVIYGHDDAGNFLVADPQQKPGLHVIEPDAIIAAISTAQIECDNVIFQIDHKS